MTIWAIVPVKPLRRGKSRLAGVLTEDQRAELNSNLLKHTLSVLSTLSEWMQVLVVSRDPHALAIARSYDAKTVQEDGQPHLNTALERATIISQLNHTTQGVLILPADLPLLQRDDVLSLVARSVNNLPVVVIAPDRRDNGTNALLTIPAGIIEYDYGEGSFQRHCERAKSVGAHLEIVKSFSLGLDLDLPEDLEMVQDLDIVKV
jgi:2-phospho-L-lactate guanylyltransferase